MTTLRRLPWVLSSLDDPRESVGFVGPNWYASVMGTGIVAIAATTLPILGSDLHVFAEVVWVVAVLLLVGTSLIGTSVAVTLDWVLWSAGTLGGLLTAVCIPFLLFTRYEVRPDAAFGGWLMPVVPPWSPPPPARCSSRTSPAPRAARRCSTGATRCSA